MKRNVDLTDNQIFSSNNNFFNLIDVRLLLGSIVGAQEIKSDYDLVNPDHEVYFTGNQTQRAEKRYYQQDKLNELYCDCCGKRLIYVPYRKINYSLCKECGSRFEEEDVKISKRFRIPYYDIDIEDKRDERPLDNIFLWD